MSTGDVRRPSGGKLTKAVAADIRKPKDEVDEAGPRDDDANGGADSKPTSSGATSTATGSRAAGSKSAGSRATPAKATPAKATPGKRSPAKAAPAKAAPTKAAGSKAAASKTTASKTAASKTSPATEDAETAPSKTEPAKASAIKTSGAAKSGAPTRPATKARPGGRPPVKGAGGRGRRPVAPVKVHSEWNWGPIALFVGAGVAAILIIGFAAIQLYRQSHQPTWQEKAAGIDGLVDYYKTDPQVVGQKEHAAGILTYKMNPPVAGNHNGRWQNCMGDVYTSEVAKEHAVHSLEHGAVWIAYRPDLPANEIETLASKVRDKEFMLMSPYPGLDKPISLQAWGYQLKVDRADDGRIDQFIDALRKNATLEPQAGCSGGITDATGKPMDLPNPPAPGS